MACRIITSLAASIAAWSWE